MGGMSGGSSLAGGPILAVWAHPDDESFLAAGTLLAARRRGEHVVCVYATHGEHGRRQGRPSPSGELERQRRRELTRALAILGVADHRCFEESDGGLTGVPFETGVARIEVLLDEIAPRTVLTFGPDGFTGHPDHIAVHRWVVAALGRRAAPPRLWQAAVPVSWARRYAAPLGAFDVFWPGHPVTPPVGELTAHALPDDDLDVKVAALRAHHSQTAHLFALLGERWLRAMVATEWFQPARTPRLVPAWHPFPTPATAPTAARRTDDGAAQRPPQPTA